MINRICTHKNKLIIIRESLFVGLKLLGKIIHLSNLDK